MAVAVPAIPELDRFLEHWAKPTETSRSHVRWHATPEDFQAFYAAVLPNLDDLMDYLDQFPLGQIPDDARPLYYLALAFAEAAPHCELYDGSSEVPNSFSAERFVAAHGDLVDE